MSNFDSKSLKLFTLKSTTTYQCYTSKTLKLNRYLTSPLIKDDATYDNFSNTTYEVYVPSFDNEW